MTIANILQPAQEGKGPAIPRFTFRVQQGPLSRATFEFGCPRGSVYASAQLWAIFGRMRKIAIAKSLGTSDELSPRVWCFLEPEPDAPQPLYAPGYVLFP